MLELRKLRDDAEAVKAKLAIKNFKDLHLVDDVLKLDEQRRSAQLEVDNLKSESNQLAKQIGQLFKEGKREEADKIKVRTVELKGLVKEKEESMKTAETQMEAALVLLPNIPHESVPPGTSEEDNKVNKERGEKPVLGEGALPHWEILEKHHLMSLELGVKIAGAGFPVFTGDGARLQRALVAFFLDEANNAGYLEVIPPLLVNEQSAFGTGQLPDKEGQMYHVTNDDLYMIPTAEVPITNIYRGELLKEDQLPIKMCGHSQCFRREAGSYGAHVRGLNRVHQFEKVEIVQLVHPDKSYEVLNEMAAHVEGLIQKLGLTYRILTLCGGDVSFASALTYDFEVWSAAQERWLEVSSVSNFETFQTNRMKTRFKDENKKTQLVHSLNGSALALPRIIATLLENNQQADGSVTIPAVLVPYFGKDKIG